MTSERFTGVLRSGWNGAAGDYAIAGGWSMDGSALVIGDSAGGVFVFHGKSGDLIWSEPEIHNGGVLTVATHPTEPFFVTTGQDGTAQIWEIKNRNNPKVIEVGTGWIENAAWAPDGSRLALTFGRELLLYSSDGVETWRSEEHPSTVSALAWSGADEVASACYGRVTFFGASAGEVRQKLEWKGSLVSMVLSPDGDVVACGSQDNSVHFWRRSTGEDSMMSGYPGKPSSLAFDAAGKLLATSGGDVVTVWSFHDDGPEGTHPGVLDLHERPVSALAFARKSSRLASGGRDGTIAIWDVQEDGEGRPIGAALLENTVSELYWRPDGRALAALDGDGGVTVWRVA